MKMINGVPDYILHWEAYDNLYYKGEFLALIKLQKAYISDNPGNPREKLMLADAYKYAGQLGQALKILKGLHKFDPDDTEFTHALIECLDAMEMDPKDYPFRRKVLIFEGAEESTTWCYNYLKKEGVPSDVFNLLFEMEVEGYVRFEEDDLKAFLAQDGRFKVDELKESEYPSVALKAWSEVDMAL